MKRILILLLSLSLFSKTTLKADEGMWLPMLLGEQVYADMVKKGLKLTKEQLYSINQASIKDAIIIFGGGCTGEIVSKEGLIFTNHHCGYSAIASASSVDHNYLRDGFWAKTKQEEIYAPGVHAQFLVKIVDVTDKVNEKIKDLKALELSTKLPGIMNELATKETEGTGYEGRIASMFKGNQFLLFVYERYKDVRLVGTPPESIGKFGGDTDNWEWPRHTGDFSIFRVYMSKDGKAADYSPENVPLKPKHFLPVSIKGFKDGDYARIYGYPGSTNRYETSMGVKQKVDIDNPTVVKLRDMRLKYMFEEMKKDPAVKLQLASSYASIANYWKFFDGESKQLVRYKIFEQKQQAEAGFQKWADSKPEFQSVFADWDKAYNQWRPYSKHRVYINEGIMGSPLLAFAASLQQLENAMVKSGSSDVVKKALAGADEARTEFLKDFNKISDQNIIGSVLYMYYNDIDKNQHPIGFFENIKATVGDIKEEGTYRKFAAQLVANTMILDEAKWKAFMANPNAVALQGDPAFATATAFTKNWQGKFFTQYA